MSSEPDLINYVGAHRIRQKGNVFDSDVFISTIENWNRLGDYYACHLGDKRSRLIDETLLHELGHAVGLGHNLIDTDSVMSGSSNNKACVQNKAWRPNRNGVNEVFEASIYDPIISGNDFIKLKQLYPQQHLGRVANLDLSIISPENNEYLHVGQNYVFSAGDSGATAHSSTTQQSSNTTNSDLNWVWASDVDGIIGSGKSITVNNLSAGRHSITVKATSDDNTDYGEKVISVQVISDGFYGEDSTSFFPSPCVKYVSNPSLGCLLSFSGEIAYPSGSCGPDHWATFTVKNKDTEQGLTTSYVFGSDNCSPTHKSDRWGWYFWLKSSEDQALVQGTFQGHQPNCSYLSDLCFSSTYTALIPIRTASIELDFTPLTCELSKGATHCPVTISWWNGEYHYYSGLFYRENSQTSWKYVGPTHSRSGSITTEDIVDVEGVEFAIFQYAKNPFGTKPFISLPKGQMTGVVQAHGVVVPNPTFLGQTVIPFLTSTTQDEDEGSWNVLDNGTTLNLYGNTWKAINYNYNVTASTWLKFDYKSEGPDSPEIAGIVLLDYNDIANGKSASTFQIDGTQTYGNQWFNRYFDNGWKTYDINVGKVMKHYSSGDRSIKYMGFIGDIDQANKQIDISYRNPVLYQKATQQYPVWGHSGNWYESDTSGQGFAIEVNPINEMIVLEWFTYTENGGGKGASYNRWYSKSGPYIPNSPTQDEVSLNIYQSTGGRFNRSDTVNTKLVGKAKIRFFDCINAQVEYDFYTGYNSGRKGTIPITRIAPNVDCRINKYTGPYKSDFGYTGNWHNSATSGQGFMFEVNPVAGKIIGQWFTYLPGWSSNLANPNRQRWFNIVGDYTPGNVNANALYIYQNKGGAFDDPHSVTSEIVGTAKVTFTSCTTAKITFNFTGGNEFKNLSDTINLVRITSNVTCE